MFELLAQIVKYVFVGLIYYFLYNFLKVMVADLMVQQEGSKYTGFILMTDDGREIPLLTINTIGRAHDADIVIDNSFLSSKHALIAKRGRKMVIQDLHSTNGIFINGRKIKKQMALKEKDEITMGGRKYTFIRREAGGTKDGVHL